MLITLKIKLTNLPNMHSGSSPGPYCCKSTVLATQSESLAIFYLKVSRVSRCCLNATEIQMDGL